jgi:actin-related protein
VWVLEMAAASRDLVLDNGSGFCKIGWANSDVAPLFVRVVVVFADALMRAAANRHWSRIVPNAIMKNKNGRRAYVAGQISESKNHAALFFKRPFEKVHG